MIWKEIQPSSAIISTNSKWIIHVTVFQIIGILRLNEEIKRMSFAVNATKRNTKITAVPNSDVERTIAAFTYMFSTSNIL